MSMPRLKFFLHSIWWLNLLVNLKGIIDTEYVTVQKIAYSEETIH